jgi:phage shock protein E
MGFLDSIFGGAKKAEHLKEIFLKGAIIVDVRSPEEFQSGHIKGSVNIPLHEIQSRAGKLKHQNKPVIAVCLSGGRSSMAVTMLKNAGIESYNGGSWSTLMKQLC